MLDVPYGRLTFVLQRRINYAFPDVERVLCAGGEPIADLMPLGTGDRLHLVEPFRVVTTWPGHGWRAQGRLRDARGRRIAAVELEFAPWADDCSELSLRPLAGHPERWMWSTQRSYFRAAHAAADHIAARVGTKCERRERLTSPVLVGASK